MSITGFYISFQAFTLDAIGHTVPMMPVESDMSRLNSLGELLLQHGVRLTLYSSAVFMLPARTQVMVQARASFDVNNRIPYFIPSFYT